MPIQQMLLGVGAVASKTYIDDVFNNYLWRGNSTDNRAINVGFDYTTDEGLVWIKNRQDSDPHCLFDTLRGANKRIATNTLDAETTTSVELKSFTSTGYTLGTDGTVNGNTKPFVSYNFKSSEGFLDIITFSGDGTTTGRAINHGLKSKPGFIIVKRLDSGGSAAYRQWFCYHDALPDTYQIKLSSSDPKQTNGNDVFGTGSSFVRPTSTQFTVGEFINFSGGSYVAYLFGGGESSASEAVSVDFDGSGDYLSLASTADLSPGTGDFTFEAWIKPDTWRSGNYDSIWTTYQSGTNSGLMITSNGSNFVVRESGVTNHLSIDLPPLGQWTHVAVTRSSSTLRIFINGTLKASASNSTNFATAITSIASDGSGADFNGKISNLRFVKGTAVYTSSFRPPTEPLTNITNTKLLCCNGNSTTSSTVTPGTITANGSPTANSDSPFDDPASFVFGENEDQEVIKHGSYISQSGGVADVYLGFEPQWVMIKRSDDSGSWLMFDSMRGIPTRVGTSTGYPDAYVLANSNAAESSSEFLTLTPTGFKTINIGGNGDEFIFTAIRRSDGYCGKPADAGTGVFNMPLGSTDGTKPSFNTGFPADYLIFKKPAATGDWFSMSRLTGPYQMFTNNTDAEGSNGNIAWDFQDGVGAWSALTSGYQGWGFKRGAGFDVVTYAGGQNIYNSSLGASDIRHNLGKVPEMLWVRRRNSTENWVVYHKGVNGGTNPENYYMFLNNTGTASTFFGWGQTAFTSTHFTVADGAWVNGSGSDYVAFLFASTDVSAVGSYSGNGSTGQTISTGFAPRFVIIRKYNDAAHWLVLDTTRGWGSGDDKYILLNSSGAQGDYEVGAPTSNGFTLVGDNDYNNSSGEYIYYAHA
jgi:hypothetical protein